MQFTLPNNGLHRGYGGRSLDLGLQAGLLRQVAQNRGFAVAANLLNLRGCVRDVGPDAAGITAELRCRPRRGKARKQAAHHVGGEIGLIGQARWVGVRTAESRACKAAGDGCAACLGDDGDLCRLGLRE